MSNDFTDTQLLEFAAIHDFDDPMSELNKIEMTYLAVLGKTRGHLNCQHCDVELKPMPMHGTAWGLAHFHDRDCPIAREEEGR